MTSTKISWPGHGVPWDLPAPAYLWYLQRGVVSAFTLSSCSAWWDMLSGCQGAIRLPCCHRRNGQNAPCPESTSASSEPENNCSVFPTLQLDCRHRSGVTWHCGGLENTQHADLGLGGSSGDQPCMVHGCWSGRAALAAQGWEKPARLGEVLLCDDRSASCVMLSNGVPRGALHHFCLSCCLALPHQRFGDPKCAMDGGSSPPALSGRDFPSQDLTGAVPGSRAGGSILYPCCHSAPMHQELRSSLHPAHGTSLAPMVPGAEEWDGVTPAGT